MLFPLLLAAAAATLYAITNHIDKFLVSKASAHADHRALVVMSTLVAGGMMAIIYAFVCGFRIELFNAQSFAVLAANAVLYAITLGMYFCALKRDDTTIIVIMFNLVPVFSLLLSPLFLSGQEVRPLQLVGCLIVLLAAMIVTFESDKKRFSKAKLITLLMMAFVSLGYSLWFILTRVVTQNHDFELTTFWLNVMVFAVGLLAFLLLKKYRKSFTALVEKNGPVMFGLNITNELFNSFGMVLTTFAGTMIPVALVSFCSQGVQPFMSLLIGLLLTTFFPKIGKENVSKGEIARRVITVLICAIGLACINFG